MLRNSNMHWDGADRGLGAVLASTAAINQLKALIVSAPDDFRA
ncbi:hypothetical protein [Streptomyces mirabilis]